MSLQVWLPLMGTLENKGISNINITTNTATVDSNGKIGSCYSFASGNKMQADFSINNSPWSVACWFYSTSSSTSSHQYMVSMQANANSSSNFLFSLCLYQDRLTTRLSGTSYNSTDGAISQNTWYHGCTTYDGANLKIYLNGNQVYSSNSVVAPTASTILILGQRVGAYGNYTGKLNDVRIYDHCLSDAEVHEIAQGLVLHYKLDGGVFGNPNLVLGSNTAATSTNKWGGHSATGGNTSTIVYDGDTPCVKVTRDNVAQSSWDYLSYERLLQSQIKTNTTYTITFDCKPDVNGSIGFTGFINGNATNSLTASVTNVQNNCYANQWNHMKYKCTTKASFDGITIGGQIVYFSRSASLRAVNVNVLFKNLKVEEGDAETPWCPADSELSIDRTIVEDSSGYGHNGATVTPQPFTSNTPRYSAAYTCNGNVSHRIYCNSTDCNFTDNFSFAVWCKANHTGTAAQYLFTVGRADAGGYGYGIYNNGDTNLNIRFGNAGYNVIITKNEWAHIAFTKTGNTIKIYKNGVMVSTNTFSGTLPTYSDGKGIGLGCFHYSGGDIYPAYGALSDFRIYCTALSADDILQLYHTGAKIDNKNNIHSYEFEEYSNSKSIMKTGVFKISRISEHYNINTKITKEVRPNLLPGILDIVTTKSGHTVRVNTLGIVPSNTMTSLAGQTLTLSMDICAPGDRYSTENGQTAWNQIRYGVHGAMSRVNNGGTSGTDYPFTDNFQYSGPAQRWYQTWTIPANYQSYGNFSISVQNFDKPASTNNAIWFFRNIKLEVGSYPTPYVENNSLSAAENNGLISENFIEL